MAAPLPTLARFSFARPPAWWPIAGAGVLVLAPAILLGPWGGADGGLFQTSTGAHPAVVGCLSAGAVLLMLAAAKVLGLHRLGSKLLPANRSVAATLDELADLAGKAKAEGLLPAVADPRARSHPILVSGIHLLARDADEKLVRSSLEAEMDRSTAANGRRAGAIVAAIRGLTIGLLTASAGAAVLMGSMANDPSTASAGWSWVIMGTVFSAFVAAVASGPAVRHVQRRSEAAAFARLAAVETVEAIRLGEDRGGAAARLARLTPESPGMSPGVPAAARRAA